MFLPRLCPICRRPDRAVCPACRRELRTAAFRGTVPPTAVDDGGLDDLTALWRYVPASRSIVLAMKNGARRDLARGLGPELAQLVAKPEGSHPDVLTWVPASGRGRRRRGLDQGRLLATEVGRNLGIRPRGLLRRLDRNGGTVRSRVARLGGPQLEVRRPVEGTVLVVDDVVTTGRSMAVAAAALRSAGASEVVGVALAVVDDGFRPPPGAL